MPPALHPRSRLTTSLFTSTLLISFLVVGTPHILPCPAPRHQYTDSPDDSLNPRPRRRRRRKCATAVEGDNPGISIDKAEVMFSEKPDRECPIPKPGGLVGRILGFREREGGMDGIGQRPVVKVESIRRRRTDSAPEIITNNSEATASTTVPVQENEALR